MPTGLIFDIKRYAIHDGPGIRSTVFFKGCPLSCRWCHNPEGIGTEPQVIYHPLRCIGCGACIPVCPHDALRSNDQGIESRQDRCRHCGVCVRECPAEARRLAGETVGVAQVMAVLEKDVIFYDQSGGGVTFSGGEPLMQPQFLMALLIECGKRDIHRTVDTSGYGEAKLIMEVARHTDLFLYDLKHMHPRRHMEYTGVSNHLILRNLELLARSHTPVRVRIPVIPGINTDVENLRASAAFLTTLTSIDSVELLPFHRASRGKYARMGIASMMPEMQPPSSELLKDMTRCFEAAGLQVRQGGELT